jgi:quercetin dioxygenase-like cupin family protein/uracil-DNA glycosylase
VTKEGLMTYKHDDGSLILAEWALRDLCETGVPGLFVPSGPRTVPMYGTKASGERLVSNGQLGLDLIQVPAGEGFSPHTHPGDHLLIAVAGEGTVTVDGAIYPTRAGQVYMVEGAVPHAVGAITDHVILAVGSPHRAIDAADRMTLTDYLAVAAHFHDLKCLVCDGAPEGSPQLLREAGCTHLPAEAPTSRPLVVGLAPATPAHEGRAAFADTESGDKLAALLDVGGARLLDTVDTAVLSPIYVSDWQKVSAAEWCRLAAERILPMVPGRVVVACGSHVGDALGVTRFSHGRAYACGDESERWLAVTIHHPHSGYVPVDRSRSYTDPEGVARAEAALALACNLARTGPAENIWTDYDADAFNEAADRLTAERLHDRS